MHTQNHRAYDELGRRKYLTKSEGLDFLQIAKTLSDRERLLCETIYYVGCRPSEAITLKTNDIDQGELVLSVRCLKKRGNLVIRRLPIPDALIDDLLKLGPGNAEGLLWPISRTTAWRIVGEVMRGAGIRGIHASPKGLRHGFAVRSAMERVPVSKIQSWMGHASESTTSIYLNIHAEEDRELMRRTWYL